MTALPAIAAVAMAPDASWAATVATDGTVRLWGVGQSAWRLDVTLPPMGGQSVAVSMSGSDQVRVLWAAGDVLWLARISLGLRAQGNVAPLPVQLPARLRAIGLAPAGHVAILACDDGTIRSLDVRTGEFGWTVTVGPQTAVSVAIASDGGPVVAAFSDGSVRHYDIEAGTSDLLVSPDQNRRALIAVAGGSVVTAYPRGPLMRWRPKTSPPLEIRAAGLVSSVAVTAIAAAGDSVLIATDDGLWLYDFAGDRLTEFGPPGAVRGGLADLTQPARQVQAFGPPPADPAGAARDRGLLDDDVRFTVYRPQVMSPGAWATLLVFAHKTDVVHEPGQAPIDPNEQVRRLARAHFSGPPPSPAASDARSGVFRGTRLRVVPELPGIRCNPQEAEFSWLEPVHEAVFRLSADAGLVGTVVRGAVRVWCGPLLIGEVSIAISIAADGSAAAAPPVTDGVQRYRKIFPSYSHDDRAMVAGFAEAARALGDQYLQDVLALRAGEQWESRLRALIEQADVFQLFWSSNSMRSRYCRQEWEHALALRRPAFVRPLYWEDPLPQDPARGLPPVTLRELHFVKVGSYQPQAAAGEQVALPPAMAAPSPAQPAPSWAPPSPGYDPPASGYHSPSGHDQPAYYPPGIPASSAPRLPASRRRALVLAALVLVLIGVLAFVAYQILG